jgi:hypothetical protein
MYHSTVPALLFWLFLWTALWQPHRTTWLTHYCPSNLSQSLQHTLPSYATKLSALKKHPSYETIHKPSGRHRMPGALGCASYHHISHHPFKITMPPCCKGWLHCDIPFCDALPQSVYIFKYLSQALFRNVLTLSSAIQYHASTHTRMVHGFISL